MKYKWKKITILTLTAYILGISTAGCGSAPAAEAEAEEKETDTIQPTTDKAEDTPDDSAETRGSGKWQVYDPDVAAAVDADFEGVVYKIETDSFQNIEKEVSVALKGTFQNDVFCADQIRITKVH